MSDLTLYTLGHDNLSAEAFLARLRAQGITTLVDVRSSPYSGYVPHFNRELLEAYLRKNGIAYWYAGDSLGGRPDRAELYKSRQLPSEADRADFLKLVDYEAVMQDAHYQQGLRRLVAILQEAAGRVAIMCSEVHPQECHRHHLIARSLVDERRRLPELPLVQVVHILKTGELEVVDPAVFDEGPQQLSLF